MEQLSTQTLNITDFKLVKASAAKNESRVFAKVVIAFTGKHTKETIQEAISAKLKRLAAPVENSFRIVKAGVAVGFVRANREIRVPESEKELRANYRVLGSNIVMDNEDKTLWAVKKGASGTYLTRHGSDDLGELISAAQYPRPDVPHLGQISLSAGAKNEFAAFVSPSGDMDYGFVTAANPTGSKVKVVSYRTKQEQIVPAELCTAFYKVAIPKSAHQQIVKAGISPKDKADAVKYWTELYQSTPAYMDMVIKQVEDDTTAA